LPLTVDRGPGSALGLRQCIEVALRMEGARSRANRSRAWPGRDPEYAARISRPETASAPSASHERKSMAAIFDSFILYGRLCGTRRLWRCRGATRTSRRARQLLRQTAQRRRGNSSVLRPGQALPVSSRTARSECRGLPADRYPAHHCCTKRKIRRRLRRVASDLLTSSSSPPVT